MLDTTSQPAGAVTVNRNAALRSGWSKQANTRCASAVANWLWRYTWPSTGSVKLCSPCPVCEYAQSATTRSSFSPARSGSGMRPVAGSYSAGSMADPLRTTSRTSASTRSQNTSAPGSAQRNRTSVVEPNRSGPVVRSSSTA